MLDIHSTQGYDGVCYSPTHFEGRDSEDYPTVSLPCSKPVNDFPCPQDERQVM